MSQNLHVTVDGKPLQLFQTPTQITEMCMCTESGVEITLTGKKAKRALECYLAYVRGSLNGAYASMEEVNQAKSNVKTHLEYIKDEVAKGKKLVVYQM